MKLLLSSIMMLSLSVSAFASRSAEPIDFSAADNFEAVSCGADLEGTQVSYELEQQRDAIANALILLAGTKTGGNYRGTSFEGCKQNTEMTAEFFIDQLDLKRRFRKIARKIRRIYPSVDLKENLDQTIMCQTDSRLEKILGGQHDPERTMIWMPQYKNNADYIMFNEEPVNNSKDQRDELVWALVKEMLHNHIGGNEYHVRDVQLQLILKALKAHIDDKTLNKKQLQEITHAFSFPIKK